MNSKRHKFKLITGYIAVITIFFVLSIIFYNLLLTTNKYYLFIVIPLLFLSISTSLFNLLKLLFTIVSFMFSKNDNDEVLKSINKRMYFTKKGFIRKNRRFQSTGSFCLLFYKHFLESIYKNEQHKTC